MFYYWILVTFWFGTASLQHISSADTNQEFSPLDQLQAPLRYSDFLFQNLPPLSDLEAYQREREQATSGTQLDFGSDSYLPRLRRTIEESKHNEQWMPELIDTDKTTYLHNDKYGDVSPFLLQAYTGALENNGTELVEVDKKNFSPWGGKRSEMPGFENMWSWKRAITAREPSMPKRVRFSPWGGKRSGQIIVKPGVESSRLFLASLPELIRIVSSYYPKDNDYNLQGYQFIPSSAKGHPVNILTLSAKTNDGMPKESGPLKRFLESLPQIFKTGHPYQAVNLKKDGKRKVKFSAWGGKRSPPIIGPIWTPATENVKDPTLNELLFYRNTKPTTSPQ